VGNQHWAGDSKGTKVKEKRSTWKLNSSWESASTAVDIIHGHQTPVLQCELTLASPGSFHVFILRLGQRHWLLSFWGFQLITLSSCCLLWLSSLQIAMVKWFSMGSCKPS
jgi:hypothetical protein